MTIIIIITTTIANIFQVASPLGAGEGAFALGAGDFSFIPGNVAKTPET